MGRKGSWFSAIKRVFVPNSKEKLEKGSEKKSSKEKKGRGILKHAETKSFIPLFREPSSIEKILGEVDQQQLHFRPPTPYELPKPPPSLPARPASPRSASFRVTSPRNASQRITSPRAATSRRVTSPRAASPRVTSPRAATPRAASPRGYRPRPEPTLRNHHLSATKIQAAYRGYMARRSFRALRGLVRLQGVVRGQNVKRQTSNAMKHMQLLVRVQTQIQSRRIQMLENQALQRQANKNDRETESTLGKWNSEAGDNENWDDSLLTKEEVEARMQKKVEAIVKRERAMAYAYSHQLWKGNSKPGQSPPGDIVSGGFPWWWTWLERQLPSTKPPENQTMKTFLQAPMRPTPEHKPSPRSHSNNYKQHNFGYDNLETPTPKSSRSAAPVRTRQMFTPTRTPPSTSSNMIKYARPRNFGANSPYDVPLKDDDSLVSCPPFSVPNYMSPTVSAIAKVRPTTNLKESAPGTPGSQTSKRRFSFPLAPSMGSFKWNKGSSKDSASVSQKVLEKHRPPPSIGDRSVDSTVSMPAAFGRKPFNRFV